MPTPTLVLQWKIVVVDDHLAFLIVGVAARLCVERLDHVSVGVSYSWSVEAWRRTFTADVDEVCLDLMSQCIGSRDLNLPSSIYRGISARIFRKRKRTQGRKGEYLI